MDYKERILNADVYGNMSAEHLEYLKKNHPDIWNERPVPLPGLFIVELGVEKKGGIQTTSNPTGMVYFEETHKDRILVGESEFCKPGSFVRVEGVSIYQMREQLDGKGNRIKVPNQSYSPHVAFDNKTKKDSYVVVVTIEQIPFIYETSSAPVDKVIQPSKEDLMISADPATESEPAGEKITTNFK